MPTTNQDIQKVEEQRKQASAKNREAADYGAASTTLGDNVWEAVRADRRERGVSQIATDVGNVMGQMASQPENIKSFAGDMVNPMDVDQFTGQARASQLRTLGTIATQQGENYGTLQEIIQAGANQLVARGQIKMADAQRLSAEADALMERLSYEEEIRQYNESFSEQQRQFNETMSEKRATGSGGSGGGASSELKAWFEKNFGTDEQQGAEPQPLYTPLAEGVVSDGGQWVYRNGSWVQNTQGQSIKPAIDIGPWEFLE